MITRARSRASWHMSLALGACLVCCLLGGRAAAAPQISNLSIRGLRTGASTTLTIEGTDLLPNPRIILAAPITSQAVKEGAAANRVQIDVALPANVPPGIYHLRVGNPKGISNSVVIGIDDLAQVPFGPQVNDLPAALHGNLAESAILQTSFAGKKGQRVIADVEARRLGAAIDPVLNLYDPRRVQLAWSQPQAALGGDARLEATLPADGQYIVELYDLSYKAGNPNHFRLKIGELSYADLAFPLGGQCGTEGAFELLGNVLPPGTRVKVDLRTAAGDVPVPFAQKHGLTGSAPRIIVGDFPEVLEAEPPPGKLQEVTVPVVINGRIGKANEEDRYRLLVKPGMKLRFEVMANRAGSPLDGVLFVRNDAGAQLAMGDDQPDKETVDPGLDYTVPDGVTALVVALKDLEGRGGPNYVYRLSITPSDYPDFSLTLLEDRQLIPQGGSAVMRVRANRAGYNGPIKLSIPELPQGIKVSGAEIPAGVTDTLLSFSAPGGTSLSQTLARVIGESTGTPVVRRTALLPVTSATQRQPWLRSELAVAVTEPEPISVAWDTSETSLAIGASYPAKVRATRAAVGAGLRPAPTTGPIRLSLLTSQIVPKTPDGKQDDLNRALRFAGTPVIAAGQTVAAAPIIVPGDLPALPYDLAIRAELLDAGGKTVLATAVTPGRRLPASKPFVLRLTSAAKIEAKSGSGPTGKLVGKVVRAPGFNKLVTVTLTGLPVELPAPSVIVLGYQSDFELPVSFPYDTKLGPLPNVKLVATSSISPQQVLKSDEFPIAVQVVKGEPPPPPPPLYKVFEDEPGFVALLFEGDGSASLEMVDRYSGSAALRVSGSQRFRSKMPGWGFKIAEKPGNGEFRYLRFAWKKQGGDNILLQLNANGQWGPTRDKPGPAYRYEAGPGNNPFNAAAIKIDPKLPEDWVVVTRDLFADFGSFALTGMAFRPGPGDYALFDHIYLARSMEDLKRCPEPIPPQQPFAIFEDQADFVANLLEGAGTATLETGDKYSGKSSVKVTPDQRFNERLPGLGIKIRQNPGRGEYRFLRFAWKKKGGQIICLQLNHDGQWGPAEGMPAKFRYHAGVGPEPYGASVALANKIPEDWVVVTRDLYADFGEFTLTGIALSPIDGEYGLFDHIYLGRTTRDFELVKPKVEKPGK